MSNIFKTLMRIVTPVDAPSINGAGAVETDLGEINPWIVTGALTGVGVAGFGVMLAATVMPAQTIGAAAVSASLLGYGVYQDQQDEKSDDKSDVKSDTKSTAKAKATPAPAAG